MPRRGENIRKRKDGRWEGRYKKGRKNNGNIIYGSVYGKTYREVKEKLLQVAATGNVSTQNKCKEICFKQVLLLWLENNRVRYKGATEARYEYLIEKHISPELGDIKISEITAPMINSFLRNKLDNGRLDNSGGLSAAYVRSIMLVINSALRFAAEEQLCEPLKSSIYKPSVPRDELAILNIEQQKLFERYLITDLDCTKTGILISLYTGLRIGEICALRWDDVDLQKNIIHVRHTIARVKDNSSSQYSTRLIMDSPKTPASIRDIPLPSPLKPILTQMKENKKSQYVISDTPYFVNPRTYDYRYHKLLSDCGLPSINYHALRHTFATRCVEAGVDIKSLSEILGHANVGITLNTYVHSSMELKRTQIEKLTFCSA